MLTIKQLSVFLPSALGQRAVLQHFDLTVSTGDTCALVGANGSGKTTLARFLVGLLPSNATVTFDDVNIGNTDVRGLSPDDWDSVRGSTVLLTPQLLSDCFSPTHKIGKHFQLAFRYDPKRGFSESSWRESAEASLKSLGIADPHFILSSYAHELSGGTIRLAALALGLCLRPKLWVLDEPTAGVDRDKYDKLRNLLRHLRARVDSAILLISHDLSFTSEIADYTHILHQGAVLETLRRGDDPRHAKFTHTKLLYQAANRFVSIATHS